MLLAFDLSLDNGLVRIGLCLAGILAFLIISALIIPLVQAFKADLKYIEMEINRTDGREQAHWIRRKKELWLSLIPFYRPRRRHRRHRHD